MSSWTRFFCILCHIFLQFLMIFQSGAASKNAQIWPIMKKSRVKLALLISWIYFWSQKPDFRDQVHHYYSSRYVVKCILPSLSKKSAVNALLSPIVKNLKIFSSLEQGRYNRELDKILCLIIEMTIRLGAPIVYFIDCRSPSGHKRRF